MKPKVLVIAGPTASGKSSLAVYLAKKFNGEVISADSRQVYKGLDIGTEKITGRKMGGIPHYMLDIVSPRKKLSVKEYKRHAQKRIEDILSRGKLPIVVGGTGFYIDAVVKNITFPEVPSNEKLRERLLKKSADELFLELAKKDPVRAKTIEQKNKRRLIRALEIIETLGKVPITTENSPYDVLWIGLKAPKDDAYRKKIKKRVGDRLKRGAIHEVEKLHKKGLSWKRLEEIGLGYKIIADYLRGRIQKDALTELITTAEWQYAKRQKTWFKRNKKIHWVRPTEKKKINTLVKKFL